MDKHTSEKRLNQLVKEQNKLKILRGYEILFEIFDIERRAGRSI